MPGERAAFPVLLTSGGFVCLVIPLLFGTLAILGLNTHVPPFLRQVLGLKHLLHGALGFSDPLLVKLMVPFLLQVATKAVAMGTKATLAVPTGHAVDKSQRARSVWGHPMTAHRGACSGRWHSEQPGEPLGAQVLPGG